MTDFQVTETSGYVILTSVHSYAGEVIEERFSMDPNVAVAFARRLLDKAVELGATNVGEHFPEEEG